MRITKSTVANTILDFIGGQGALTAAEEKALSDFFKSRKVSFKKPSGIVKPRKHKRSKAPV